MTETPNVSMSLGNVCKVILSAGADKITLHLLIYYQTKINHHEKICFITWSIVFIHFTFF